MGKDICKRTQVGNCAWQSDGFGVIGVVHDGKGDLDVTLHLDHKRPQWLQPEKVSGGTVVERIKVILL